MGTKALVDIVDQDSLIKLSKMGEFLEVVNQTPPASFIKDHPMASGVKYIPIEKIEYMLTKIFQEWNVDILREGQLLNSVYVTVRLNYLQPITGQWQHQDGVGAAPIQTDKGKSAADLASIKNDAIMKALPSAESYAIKDAAEKIGKLFGKDLNRKDTMAFSPAYTADKEAKKEIVKEKLNENS